ncbi:MAG: hypothetical protein JXR96_25425 [Deltaproteobacteria bacterium]|nr:hypothetical protein [Deltaproteobacteria bacterium]
MDFLADKSVQGILVVAGIILGMFGLYFFFTVMSNRSIRSLAERMRRGRRRRALQREVDSSQLSEGRPDRRSST